MIKHSNKLNIATGRLATAAVLSLFVSISSMAIETREDIDTLRMLEEVTIEGHTRHNARFTSDGRLELEASQLQSVPRYFGEADLMRLVGQQGGVSSLGDFASGYSLDGADNSQNGCSIDGVPVHFPYHFGGIFSIFSQWQYPRLSLSKSIRQCGTMPVAGGEIDLYGRNQHPDEIKGSLNFGLTASTLGIETPLTKTISMSASARVSYFDALFHDLISSFDSDINYSFYDADLSIIKQLPHSTTLRLFGHYNSDKLKYGDNNFSLDTRLNWHNALGGLVLNREDANAALYVSEMGSTLFLDMEQIRVCIPSSIFQTGIRGNKIWNVKKVLLETGASFDYYRTHPQTVSVIGFGSDIDSTPRFEKSYLGRIWTNVETSITRFMNIKAGVEVDAYFSGEKYYKLIPDPRIIFNFKIGSGNLDLHLGQYHQYIHMVGLSEIGMASNFNLAASKNCKPQQLISIACAWRSPLPWLGLRIHADAYYKKIYSQPEYIGGVFNLLDSQYLPENHIVNSQGYSYGGSLTLSRDFTALSASVTYSFGIGRRRPNTNSKYFRATSELGHSVTANASYLFPGNHWIITGTFVYNSGRPVTPIKSAYLIGQYIIVEYGEHNASRLPSYQRLDLGVSYTFTSRFFGSRKLKHTVSLSLINAYGHNNVEISKYKINKETQQIYKKYVKSLYRFLPSLSYTIDF